MKRYSLLSCAVLTSLVSGCLDTADVQTGVKRDGSVTRALEFAVDRDRKAILYELLELTNASQWKVKTFERKARSSSEIVHHYVAAREFAASRVDHTDFIVRPFKTDGPLGRFEGKNRWRVTRRRGLFNTTFVYEEALRFPGLREAYTAALANAIQQRLTEQLPEVGNLRTRLAVAVRRSVEWALERQTPAGRDRDFMTLMAASLSENLNRLQPGLIRLEEEKPRLISSIGQVPVANDGGTGHTYAWLGEQVRQAQREFDARNARAKDPQQECNLLYSFTVTMPGRVTRSNGQTFAANRVIWKNVLGLECQFHDYTLHAESNVANVNWVTLLSLGVLLALPFGGACSFLKRHRVVVRVLLREPAPAHS